MQPYDHKAIEHKWQEEWKKSGIYDTGPRDPSKEKKYILVEWPYPSGNLHIGHWFAFAVVDIYVRYLRMQGCQVLFPMGFDAFGLPAENAAIKRGLDPAKWTFDNMAYMRTQLEHMGNAFSWDKTTNSTDPEYFEWTQWMFTKFFEHDIAFKGKGVVNWCPKDNTVLANEQVLADDTCERCGTKVEKREMDEWKLRITKYADRLVDDLEPLDWPNYIKDAQRNWIGRSQGAIIPFMLSNGTKLEVFTTRPDTLFGATFLVLAPEHPLVSQLVVKNTEEVRTYVNVAKQKDEIERLNVAKEKTGVRLEGITAKNPANGEEIPVFIADYVLTGYGTGAIMSVPAHDERDNAFAQKFNLPIREVVEPTYCQTTEPGKIRDDEPFDHREAIIAVVKHWAEEKYIALKWKQVAWGTFITGGIEAGQTPETAAKAELLEEVGYKNARFIKDYGVVHGKFYHVPKKTNRNAHAHLVYLELENDECVDTDEKEQQTHEVLWLTKEELKKFLTPDTHQHFLRILNGEQGLYTADGTLANSGEFDRMESAEARERITARVGGRITSTYRIRDWSIGRQRYWGVPIPIVYDPEGKAHAIPREHLPWHLPTDVDFMPTGEPPLAKSAELKQRVEKIFGKGWTPEVETMDTFVDSSWYFLRYLDNKNTEAPVSERAQQEWMPIDVYFGGSEHTTMHLLYSRFWQKALFDLGIARDSEPYLRRVNRGLVLGPDGQKMSKSKGNVIDPDEQVERLGADTVKTYLAFMGNYGEPSNYPWDMGGIVGVRRFLERIWRLAEHVQAEAPESVERLLHKTLKKVSEDIPALKFNTAIAALMIFVNTAEKEGITKPQWEAFLRMLAPFAPHITEELWHAMGNTASIHTAPWPAYDAAKLIDEEVTIAIQINGKVRDEIRVASDMPKDAVEQVAREQIAERLVGKEIKKTVVVPGRLVSFVIAE